MLAIALIGSELGASGIILVTTAIAGFLPVEMVCFHIRCHAGVVSLTGVGVPMVVYVADACGLTRVGDPTSLSADTTYVVGGVSDNWALSITLGTVMEVMAEYLLALCALALLLPPIVCT